MDTGEITIYQDYNYADSGITRIYENGVISEETSKWIEVTHPDGRSYKGPIDLQGNFYGVGKYRQIDGSIYTGEFFLNKKHGIGMFEDGDETKYGQWMFNDVGLDPQILRGDDWQDINAPPSKNIIHKEMTYEQYNEAINKKGIKSEFEKMEGIQFD